MIEMALVIALMGLLNWLSIAVIRSKRTHWLLGASVFFAQIQWYTIPAVLSVMAPSVLDTGWAARLSKDEYYFSLMLELLVANLALFLLLFIPRAFRAIRSPQRGDSAIQLPNAFILSGLAAAVIGIHVFSTGFDYLRINAAPIIGEELGLLDSILGPFASIGIAYLILVYLNHEDRRLRFLIMFVITLLGVARFFAGSRIMIALPLVVYLLGNWVRFVGRPWRAAMAGALALAGAIAILPLVLAMGSARQYGEAVTASEIADAAGRNILVAAEAVFGKYDGVATGEFLVSSRGAGVAGLMPYVGSLFVFVPRAVLPGRPVPGSYDGTYSGHPTRLVPSLVYYDSPSLNVGISPGHIAVWQFGYAGLPLAAAALAAYFAFLNRYLRSRSAWKILLALQALSIPSFHTVFTSPDVVLRNVVTMLVIMLLVSALQLLIRGRRRQQFPRELRSIHRGTISL